MLIKNFGYISMVNSNQVADTLRSQLSNTKKCAVNTAAKFRPEGMERFSEIKNMSLGNLVSFQRESDATPEQFEKYGGL